MLDAEKRTRLGGVFWLLILGTLVYIEHSQGELTTFLAVIAGFGVLAWGSIAIFGDWPTKVPSNMVPLVFSLTSGIFTGLTTLSLLTPEVDLWTKVLIFSFLGTWFSYRYLSRRHNKENNNV